MNMQRAGERADARTTGVQRLCNPLPNPIPKPLDLFRSGHAFPNVTREREATA